MRHTAAPTFYLYGEPHRESGHAFLHIEALDDRSRPSEWTIRPHAHADLNHLFLISEGGGAMRAEDRAIQFEAPCLLLVPAQMIHGFGWHRESHGSVITFGSDLRAELVRRDRDLAPLFTSADAIPLDESESEQAVGYATSLVRELGWSAPCHRSAVDGLLLGLLVAALRASRRQRTPTILATGAAASLVARFRARVEDRFRLRESVAAHASALGTSPTRLRAACGQVAGASPTDILDQRTMLEARRLLFYSVLTVAEVGYSVGLADPAYFSRFFTRHAGLSPRAYRERTRAGEPARTELPSAV